jgi:NADH-quinone oxidoreductase subunit G
MKNSSEKITFVIDENLDLESLVLLKKLENLFSEKVKIRNLKSAQTNGNFNLMGLNDKLVDINKKNSKVCFIISSNIKVENSIVNAKLRKKYLDQSTSFYSFGQNFKSTFPMEFININIETVAKLFEGKNLHLSQLLVKAAFPLFVTSENLFKRFSEKNELVRIIKKIAPTSIVYNIDKHCNLEGNSFLGIKTLSKSDINNTTTLIGVQLDDLINFRKKISNFQKRIILMNSHGSSLTNRANIAVPCLTSFEEEGIYLNLESRAQKALKIFSKVNDSRSVKNIFLTLIKMFNKEIRPSSFLSSIYETVENSFLFNTTNKKFSLELTYNSKNRTPIYDFFLYPVKTSNEDFYRSNNFTKNSIIMNKCSQELRNLNDNF